MILPVAPAPAPPDTADVSVMGRPGMVRDLLARLLHGFAGTGHEVLHPVAVLVDPVAADWERARASGSRVVLLSHTPLDDGAVAEAVLSGADAVLHTDTSPQEVRRAVAAVAAGGTHLDARQARAVAEAARTLTRSPAAAARLTGRERDILECIESGLSVKQTARHLGIALKTVENLQSKLFRKLGARNRAQAVALARGLGLLDGTSADTGSGDEITLEVLSADGSAQSTFRSGATGPADLARAI